LADAAAALIRYFETVTQSVAVAVAALHDRVLCIEPQAGAALPLGRYSIVGNSFAPDLSLATGSEIEASAAIGDLHLFDAQADGASIGARAIPSSGSFSSSMRMLMSCS
jgi:hypothetical protein